MAAIKLQGDDNMLNKRENRIRRVRSRGRGRRAVLAAASFAMVAILATFMAAGLPAAHAQGGPSQGQLSEMNVQLYANYSSMNLYITALPNVTSPMLYNFTVVMHSPGNSSYKITDPAMADPVIGTGTFSYVDSFNVDLSSAPSGIVNRVTVALTSGQLGATQNFTYLLKVMTPVQYVNYVSAHKPVTKQYSVTTLDEVGIGFAFTGILTVGIWMPVIRNLRLASMHREGGRDIA